MRIVRRWGWLLWLAAPVLLWFSLREISFAGLEGLLQRISPWQAVVLLGVNSWILILGAHRWQLALTAVGYEVSLMRILMIRLAGFGMSYFTPGPQIGGEPLQVMLLQRRERVPAMDGAASVYADRLVDGLVNFSFIVLGLVWVSTNGLIVLEGRLVGNGIQTALWGYLAPLILIPAIHLYLLRRGFKPLTRFLVRMKGITGWGFWGGVIQLVNDAETQLEGICRDRPVALVKMVLVSCVGWLFMVIEFHWLLTILGSTNNLMQMIGLLTTMRLAFYLPVPAGLGALEAALVFGGPAFGVTPETGLAASVMIRGRDISLGVVGLLFGGWALKQQSEDTRIAVKE